MNTPYLIIVAGPTASGKGSAPKKIQKYLGLSEDVQNIIVDDLVEKNPYYRMEVSKYLNGKSQKEQESIFNEPTDKDIDFFNNLYFKSRKNTDCNSGEIITQDNQYLKSCDQINDESLQDAFEKSINIIFETTGVHWPGWLFEKYKNSLQKYNIIVA